MKSSIAIAVSAALSVPTVAFAETTVYGKINASIDYIDVDKNATFYRPGQDSQRPQFFINEFIAGQGNYSTQDTFRALGQTYLSNNERLIQNPANWNPYAGNENVARGRGTAPLAPNANLFNNGEPVKNSIGGTAVAAVMNDMASAGYYASAERYLGSQYPRNVQGWGSEPFSSTNPNPALDPIVNVAGNSNGVQNNAQQVGWTTLARQYGYSNQGTNANNVAVQATQYANEAYEQKYLQEYTRLTSNGVADAEATAQAIKAGNVAGNAAYRAYADNAWSAYQNNLNRAQAVAFAQEGGSAGANNLSDYFAAQRARLNGDLVIGNVSSDFYHQQSKLLNQLERIAYSSAVVAAYKPGEKFSGWGMNTANPAGNNTQSYIGVKGSEKINSGLNVVYQVELGVDITSQNRDNFLVTGSRDVNRYGNNSVVSMRNSFVGLESRDYGTVLFGRMDSPLKIATRPLDLFHNTIGNFNSTVGFQDLRFDNVVAYISPTWKGFQFMGSTVAGSGNSVFGYLDSTNNGFSSSYSLAAIYKNGPFYTTVGYENIGSSNWSTQNLDYQFSFNRNAKSDSKLRFGLGLLDYNGFSLTGVYEKRDGILGAPTQSSGEYATVQGSYAWGPHVVKAMWGKTNLQSCADPNGVGFRYTCDSAAFGEYFANAGWNNNQKNKSSWGLGYDYNFSKRTQGYALYSKVNDSAPNANWSAFSVGLVHAF